MNQGKETNWVQEFLAWPLGWKDLPRAVKNREYAMEMRCGDVLGLGMRGICNRGLIQGVNLWLKLEQTLLYPTLQDSIFQQSIWAKIFKAPSKTFYIRPTPPTHRPLKHCKLQRTKLGILSLPSMWFLTRRWHTPCPTRKRSRTSAVKPCCANNNKATNPREVILSFKILYRVLNSWNATLLTFHFPGTVQHNFVPKFNTNSLE